MLVDDGRAAYPASTQEGMEPLVANFNNEADAEEAAPSSYDDPEDSQLVRDAKKEVPEPTEFSYTERDVILYNLGIGATEKELQWTFELSAA